MTDPHTPEGAPAERIELVRAGRGSDLWSAIEAAQSGRVVVHDELADPAAEEAVRRLAGALDRVVEAWEQEGLQNKAPLLALIDESLSALVPHGLSLYWGCVERTIVLADGDVAMQLAIFSVGRSAAATRRVEMPLVLDAAGGAGRGGEGS